MNLENKVVQIARPSPPPHGQTPGGVRRKKPSVAHEVDAENMVFLGAPECPNDDFVLKCGWHRVDHLVRTLYGEAEAYRKFT